MTASRAVRVAAPVLGYLGAAGLHSLWNFSTTVGTGSTFINLYFLIMVPIFAGMVLMVVWQRRREQRIVAGQLPTMAAKKWIASSEVTLLASLQGRSRWRRTVKLKVGDEAAVPGDGDWLHGRFLVLRRGKRSVAVVERTR